jgi:hypothetical protein
MPKPCVPPIYHPILAIGLQGAVRQYPCYDIIKGAPVKWMGRGAACGHVISDQRHPDDDGWDTL